MRAAGLSGTRRRSGQLVAVFSGTLFLSAFLMFLVEPMIARMVLPLLGGAASVWNTCLVFFQALLLCGYAYAHASTSRLGVRRHAIIHVCVVLVPLFVLPVRLANGAPPPTQNPVGWLLLALLMSVGLPFFVLSTSAAVLQKWYAATGDEGSRDPYFLYAASNLGSFVALIAYPLVVERMLPLRQQAQVWTAGYAVLAGMTIVCAAAAWRSAPAASPVEGPAPRPVEGPRGRDASVAQDGAGEAISWGRRARWIVLAFVPSSLLMAVTSYMSTDVAAVPLLWIVPLSLYLLTFTVAFSPSASAVRALAARLMPMATIALTLVLVAQMNQPLALVIPLHLTVFAIIALVCHGELANDRPSAARLTEFFFWIALGGMLGGLFNALVAPVVFTGIAEYPLVLVLACLVRPAAAAAPARESWRRDVLVAIVVGGAAVASVLVNNRFGSASRFLVLGAAVPALIAFSQQRRPVRFAVCVALLLLSGELVQSPFGRAVYATRTFFGVYRVRVDEQLHYRFMFHGSTLHGMQSLLPERRAASLSYFHVAGPIGQVFANVPNARATGEVAVVGLGVGSLASYAGPAQRWVFYEIDPAVERIARDPAYFTYLSDCAARCRVTIGDARLSLARARPEQFGVIILDAFSSDAIPIHLLTREAMALYVSRLAPGGIIALHISNLHLSLSPVLGRLAQAEGLTALWQREPASAGSLADGKFPSEWMVLARDARDLGRLTSDPRWTAPRVQPATPLWTDDFSNILSVLR
jgi:hypothetical protein